MHGHFLDDYLSLEITADSRMATLYPKCACPRSVPKRRVVLEFLNANGVRYGIDESAVRQFLEEWRRSRVQAPTTVATGDDVESESGHKLKRLPPPPRKGNDPVQLLPLYVKKGEPIFEDQFVGTSTQPRRNVRGETISAGQYEVPHAGPGIEIVGNRWVARRPGFLTQEDGKVLVSPTLIQKRDLPTDHYDWPNDVVIQGNVAPGTVLEAGGNVWISGSVFDSVKINAGGFIRVDGEIIGAETQVYAHGDVTARAVSSARVTAEGNMQITDRVRLATLRSYGFFGGMSEDGEISGSRISAVRGATLGQIAACRTQPTLISVGVPEWLDDSSREIDSEIVRWQSYHQKLYEDFSKKHASLLADRTKIHRLPQKEREAFEHDQEIVQDEQERIDAKIVALKTRQARLEERRQRDDRAVIVVDRPTSAGVQYSIRGKTYPAERPLAVGTTLFISPDTGRVHAIPSGLFQSSELTS